ncbi:A-kinase anchor protein 14-like isoform X2 [Choloepus didactylus]|uniref:A-kinase anchor protein 14-like isoform X2 n=1 Tax=Choloepus didactylus TaxID=27675 RepID=UPI0018A0878F|nr:A-kinase anchor protein 14-like isoform X2 [Choloepus didactylus]
MQKKMDAIKNIQSQNKMEVNTHSSQQATMDKEYNRKLDELALALAENAISAAIKTVEEAENPVKNIKWITHGEFTVETGRTQIEEFISTWEFQDCWVHYTEFVRREDLVHTFHYIYCVRWSVATARRPMARVTAAVHFIIKIVKSKPADSPIDVFYVFEAHTLIHRPGTTRFREKWLRDIIDAKHVLMESITF